MEELSEELVAHVLSSGLSLQDLLHAGRVCRRFRSVTAGTDAIWDGLSRRLFDGGMAITEGIKGKEAFRREFLARRRRMRQKHVLRVMNAQSRLAEIHLELQTHRHRLEKELSRRDQLERETTAARRAAKAHSATQMWEPVAVRKFHSDVVEQSSICSEWRLKQIHDEQRLVAVQVKQHANAIRANKAKLKEVKRELKLLQP